MLGKFFGVLAAVAASGVSAMAADYPERAITVEVGFAAGGGADALTRIVAEKMSSLLGQPVVVENRPGASGTIAGGYVARSEPDGYTLYMGSQSSLTVAPLMLDQKPFDTLGDFEPISLLVKSPLQVYVADSVAAKTFQDLVAMVKAEPGKYTYATAGIGSSGHLMAERLGRTLGLDMRHIPYAGDGKAVTDVLGGVVPIWVTATGSALPHVKSGAVRALIDTGDERNEALPDTPTAKEEGYDFTSYFFFSLLAPAGTPEEIVQKLNATVQEAYQDGDVLQRIRDLGLVPATASPEETGQFLSDDIAGLSSIILELKASQ